MSCSLVLAPLMLNTMTATHVIQPFIMFWFLNSFYYILCIYFRWLVHHEYFLLWWANYSWCREASNIQHESLLQEQKNQPLGIRGWFFGFLSCIGYTKLVNLVEIIGNCYVYTVRTNKKANMKLAFLKWKMKETNN